MANKLYEYIEGGMTLLGMENGEQGEHGEENGITLENHGGDCSEYT